MRRNNFEKGELCIAVDPLVLSFSPYVLILERIYRYSSGLNDYEGEYAYRCLINNNKKIISESRLRKI